MVPQDGRKHQLSTYTKGPPKFHKAEAQRKGKETMRANELGYILSEHMNIRIKLETHRIPAQRDE